MYLKRPFNISYSPSTSAKIWGEVENCLPAPLFALALQLLRVRLTMKCRALILPLQDAHMCDNGWATGSTFMHIGQKLGILSI